MSSVDRDATLLQLSRTVPANWPDLFPQPHAHTPPTCPGPSSTRGIVQGWRRESAVFGSGRSESDAQRPRTRQPVCSAAPAHCQSDSLLIFVCHSQLGEYQTLEGKRKSLFSLFPLANRVKLTDRGTLSGCAVRYSPANRLYIRWCCHFYTIARETCCDRM